MTPRRRWGTATDASAAMTAHRPLSSAMWSNDDIMTRQFLDVVLFFLHLVKVIYEVNRGILACDWPVAWLT